MKKLIIASSLLASLAIVIGVSSSNEDVLAANGDVNLKSVVEKETPKEMQYDTDKNTLLSFKNSSKAGLVQIKEKAPFSVKVPDVIPDSNLIGAFMQNVDANGKNLTEKNVDLFYQTENGTVHVWQTNAAKIEKDPFKVPGVEMTEVQFNHHSWYYNQKGPQHIFTTKIGPLVVVVDGELTYEKMLEVVASIK